MRTHLRSLLLYTVLTLALTLPLLFRITTHVPGVPQWAFDESTFLWNVWYLKYALLDLHQSPLHSELIWYPLGIDLILYTYNFFHALVAQPILLAANLPLASNTALLLSTVLSAYGTFLLVYYLLGRNTKPGRRRVILGSRTGHVWAAFGAGLVYAFASNRAIYATLGHYDMVTTQWIPFYALMLLRSLDRDLTPNRQRKAAVMAGLFLAMTGLAEMIAALFLGIFTLIVIAVHLLPGRVEDEKAGSPPHRGSRLQRAGAMSPSLTILAIVAFVVWSPVLVPILVQFLTDDFSLRGWGEAIPLSVDLLGWFTPTVLHPILGGDLVAELRRVQLRALELGVEGFRDINTVFLGWFTFGIALLGFLAFRRRVRVWTWTVLIFGIFTLGPFLQINGRYRFDLDGVDATIPLPFALLHYLPIIKANRAPNRNSVLLMLGLAVLVGYGLYWLLNRTKADTTAPHRKRWATGFALGLMALVVFEHMAFPLPLSDARVPPVYAEIKADPRPVSVLHAPLGWRNSFGVLGPERTQLQYYQTTHAKAMLGGNISRAPDFKLEYFGRIPFFQALVDIQFGRPVSPETYAEAAAQATDLMYLYNTAYVLLMPPIPERYPYADHWQEAWEFLKATIPLAEEPFWNEDGIEAYRVQLPEGDDTFRLTLVGQDNFPYRGEGWDAAATDQIYGVPAIWTTDLYSRLFVPLRKIQTEMPYQVGLRVHPFAYPGGPIQRVTLVVNDQVLERLELGNTWQTLTWQVPPAVLIDGLNRLEFIWEYAEQPRVVLGGERLLGTTGTELPIDAELKAFDEGGFIALFDETGQQIDGSAGRHGVNVTVLDPEQGKIVDRSGFDTTANLYESQALAEYIRQIPGGHPVLIVTYGDATAYLTAEAIVALAEIGADLKLDEVQGRHFAIAGLSGAEPDSAAVALDDTEAFLAISLNRDRRTLAAAVEWLDVGLLE